MIDDAASSRRTERTSPTTSREAESPSPPPATDDAPLWTPEEVRAAVLSAIARGQGWVAAWGVSWLVRRGFDVDASWIAWLSERAPAAVTGELLLALAEGGEVRRQPAIARALLEGLAELEEQGADPSDVAFAIAAHLDELDDALAAILEESDRDTIWLLLPALARSRDPHASALLLRLAEGDHDDELRWEAIIGLVRRGEVEAVATAVRPLLARLDGDTADSVVCAIAAAIVEGLELAPLRHRHHDSIEGYDSYGDEVPIDEAVRGLAEGCDPDTARRLAISFPEPAARKVQRSLQEMRHERAWGALVSCAARAAEIAAAESPRFAPEARAIGALVGALGETPFPARASVEGQDLLCRALLLLIAHCARAHRVDEELAELSSGEDAVGDAALRALLLVDQPWNATATFERARALLSTEDRIELLERKSDFARRNSVILRAIAEPENGVDGLLTLDAIEEWDSPLLPALNAAALCFGADALPALARRYRETPDVPLLEAIHRTAARLGTRGAREAVRAIAVGGPAPQEYFSEMVLLAMDLRDGERAREIVDALAADPSARLDLAPEEDSVPDVDEIRAALEEMVALTGASAVVDAGALPEIAARTHETLVEALANAAAEGSADLDDADLDDAEFDEGDEPWISSVSGTDLDRAMEWLAGRLPPGAVHGEHDDRCGPGCGHSHHAPVRPLHAEEKIGRNDLCPCGSGKKHKRCCGK